MIDTMVERWRRLLPDQRRWLVLNGLVITAVINFVLNAALARISAGSHATVPLWALPKIGHPSAAIDTLGTFFFLPFGMCLGVTRAVRLARDKGQLRPLSPDALGPWMRQLPVDRVKRGAVLGAICFAGLSPLAVAYFFIDDPAHLTRTSFVVYKAILAAVLGAMLTPSITLAAMAEPSPRPLRAAIA